MLKLILLLSILTLIGCINPSQHFDEVAKSYGFSSALLTTPQFKHKIYSNNPNSASLKSKQLHVYLDGDGTPWVQEQWLAEDPTARNPIILRLMQVDAAPAILLGRPCYYGLNQDTHCHFKYWTSHRYAQEVVDSLVTALKSYIATHADREIVLIGYSGGGTLAMLMAPELNNVQAIITLAANLDVRAWSQYHGYSPLSESLNPADLAPLNPKIRQFHFAGEKDTNTLPSIMQVIALKQKAHFQIIKNLTHNGCWECIWPQLLNCCNYSATD